MPHKDAHASVQDIESTINRYSKDVANIVDKYKEELTPYGLRYLQSASEYRIAEYFLRVLEDMEREKINEKDQEVIEKMEHSATVLKKLLSSSEMFCNLTTASPAYHNFIKENLVVQQRLFLKDRGRRINADNIEENALFARLQYVGYPEYYSLYNLLKEQILNGHSKNINTELSNFGSLPIPPKMYVSLLNLKESMSKIEAGKSFPYHLAPASINRIESFNPTLNSESKSKMFKLCI